MMSKKPGWEVWEHDTQELFGLDSCPGSGNQFNAPGDAVNNATAHDHSFRLFIDCKYTEKGSYSLKRDTWEEWCAQAAEQGKRPAMAIRIWPRGHLGPTEAVVLDPNDLAELLTKAEKLDAIEKAYREMPRIHAEARSLTIDEASDLYDKTLRSLGGDPGAVR